MSRTVSGSSGSFDCIIGPPGPFYGNRAPRGVGSKWSRDPKRDVCCRHGVDGRLLVQDDGCADDDLDEDEEENDDLPTGRGVWLKAQVPVE